MIFCTISDANQYMSFGLSGDSKRSVMVGGDVVVAWVDKQTLQGYAIDYYLDAKSQCSGGRGSCPDLQIQVRTNLALRRPHRERHSVGGGHYTIYL